MAYTSPKTWATGEILTSADLNTYVRDQFLALAGSTGKVDASATVKNLQGDVVLFQLLGM